MADGFFRGSEYRLIRYCEWCSAQIEVGVKGDRCWKCQTLWESRRLSSKAPWYRRMTLRGFVLLFAAVLAGLFGLAYLAASLR